jgi:hypothetical protein
MAKAAKEKDKDGRSTLDAAFRAFQAGDAVGARRLAKQVIQAPTGDDQAAVKRVAKGLVGDDAQDAHAETLAAEIVKRTRPIRLPYLWAVGGALAYALLVVLALVRYG